jgi:hypothetical protein
LGDVERAAPIAEEAAALVAAGDVYRQGRLAEADSAALPCVSVAQRGHATTPSS